MAQVMRCRNRPQTIKEHHVQKYQTIRAYSQNVSNGKRASKTDSPRIFSSIAKTELKKLGFDSLSLAEATHAGADHITTGGSPSDDGHILTFHFFRSIVSAILCDFTGFASVCLLHTVERHLAPPAKFAEIPIALRKGKKEKK
jgi:hypothetical protein